MADYYDLEEFSDALDSLPEVEWTHMALKRERWCSKEDVIQVYGYLLENHDVLKASKQFRDFRSAKDKIVSSEGNELQGLILEWLFTYRDGSSLSNRYFIVKVPDEQYAIFWDFPPSFQPHGWQCADLDYMRRNIDFDLKQLLPQYYDLEGFSDALDSLPEVKRPHMARNRELWCSKEDLIQLYGYLLEKSRYFIRFRSAKGNILTSEGNELQGLEFEFPFIHHDGSFSPNRYLIVKVPDEQYAIFWDNPEYDWQHTNLDGVRRSINFCLRQVLP